MAVPTFTSFTSDVSLLLDGHVFESKQEKKKKKKNNDHDTDYNTS